MDVAYQKAIIEAIHKVALGMAEYQQKDVESLQDLDMVRENVSSKENF